ncbi:MAG: cupredoxin domain-containing protein [Deltaproteobacteria bacterium]|nr:cupredoxin domain-containing protein [Deltaproteobacteria bacterium]
MKARRFFAALTAFAVLLFAPPLHAKDGEEFRASIGPDGVQRVDVEAGSYYFKPEHIVVKAHAPVQVKIREDSRFVPHNFKIDAPEAGMDVSIDLSREPQVIRFTPTKPGRYPFYCDNKFLFFKSHRKKGMEGTIEIVE